MSRLNTGLVRSGGPERAETVRILRDEGFDGVMIPDHTPEMICGAPWHEGKAFALGPARTGTDDVAAA
jgi:mannonate dehydratase